MSKRCTISQFSWLVRTFIEDCNEEYDKMLVVLIFYTINDFFK